MEFLEKDLEQIIYESDKGLLLEKGICISGKLFRQLRIGTYGIADLVSIEKDYNERQYPKIVPVLIITVLELKQNRICINAFLQALGYLRGIVSYIESKGLFANFNVIYQIKLIGKTIDLTNSFCYLCDLLPEKNDISFLEMYTYSYDINGIQFEQKYGYDLTNKGF